MDKNMKRNEITFYMLSLQSQLLMLELVQYRGEEFQKHATNLYDEITRLKKELQILDVSLEY